MIKQPKSAFSLIEAAIVLGIVGLVIGGIWVAASSISQKSKVNRTAEQVITVVQNIRRKLMQTQVAGQTTTFYNGSCDLSQICIPRTGWGSYLPSDMISNGNDYPVSPYNDVFVSNIDTNGIIIAIYLGDNVKACAQLGPRLYSIMAKERDMTGQPFTISTAAGGYDLSSPNVSGNGCQIEYDSEGRASIYFTLAP